MNDYEIRLLGTGGQDAVQMYSHYDDDIVIYYFTEIFCNDQDNELAQDIIEVSEIINLTTNTVIFP